VSTAGALNGPLGLTIAPNGHIITANAGDGNLVETTPSGSQVAVKTVETATGAGSLFGVAIVPKGRGVYFVDDGDNTVKVFGAKKMPETDDGGDD
jgi:DNA-binding beta-propeller fold protein YncE